MISRLVRDYLTKDDVSPEPPLPAPLSETAQEYAGWYRPDNPRVQLSYFVTRLTELAAIGVGESGLTFGPVFGGPSTELIPVSDRLFRRDSDPVATSALTSDPENGRVYAFEIANSSVPLSLHRVSKLGVLVEWAFWLAWFLGGGLIGLLGLACLGGMVFRREKTTPYARIALWPVVAVLSCFFVVVMVGAAGRGLGTPNPITITLFLLTLLFPVATVASLYKVTRTKPEGVRPWVPRATVILSTMKTVATATPSPRM